MKRNGNLINKYHQYREEGGMLIYSEWKKQYAGDPAGTPIRRIVIGLVLAAAAMLLVLSMKGQCYRNPGSLSVGLGAGYSSNSSFAVDLRIKVSSNNFFLQGGYATNTTQQVKAGSVFYAGGGYDICLGETVSLSPIIGYQFTLRSTDRKYLNTTGYAAGLTVSKYMWDGGSLYLSAINTKEQTIATIGVLATF